MPPPPPGHRTHVNVCAGATEGLDTHASSASSHDLTSSLLLPPGMIRLIGDGYETIDPDSPRYRCRPHQPAAAAGGGSTAGDDGLNATLEVKDKSSESESEGGRRRRRLLQAARPPYALPFIYNTLEARVGTIDGSVTDPHYLDA